MRYQRDTPVQITSRWDVPALLELGVPPGQFPPIVGTGVVISNAMPRPYVYCVAVDGVDPRADEQGNRYLYREDEVWPLE